MSTPAWRKPYRRRRRTLAEYREDQDRKWAQMSAHWSNRPGDAAGMALLLVLLAPRSEG